VRHAFLVITLALTSLTANARDWTDADLAQDVTLSCEMLSLSGTSLDRLVRVGQVRRTPSLRGGLVAEAEYAGQSFQGRLRVIDEGAYISLHAGVGGPVLAELVRPEFLANDDIWISYEIAPGKSVKWLCSYRASTGKDRLRLKELQTTLNLLVQGLDDISAGLRSARMVPPLTVPEACYRIGIALMRGQKLADRSNTTAVGWRARATATELRDRIAIEGVTLCQTASTSEAVREALDRIYLQVATVRDAVSPDASQ
jgi:hypothetical protein